MRTKGVKILGLIVIFLLLNIPTYAQDCTDGPGLPGVDVDVDFNQCPIDTWVIVLVIAALGFATYNLYKQQKAQKAM